MLTGDLKNQVDKVWSRFWSGGMANPLEIIEQITYLLFLKRLDDLQTLAENKSRRLKKPIEQNFFPKGKEKLRWNNLKNLAPEEMFNIVDKEVFPLPNGKRGNLLEYGKQNLSKLKSAGKIDPKLKEASDMNKEVASLITANAFPEVRKEDDSYSPNFIDVIRSIATDEFGNQYQRPLIKTSPKRRPYLSNS